jgi:gluconokinase
MVVRIIVGGPSGSGKSTIGALLALELGVHFLDGDSLHSAANVAKMSAGDALSDKDRTPWLASIGQALEAGNEGIIIACSSLKRKYRMLIQTASPDAYFVMLATPKALLQARLANRSSHFMPTSLLDSQLEIYEPLKAGETGITLATDETPQEIVNRAVQALRQGKVTSGVSLPAASLGAKIEF